MAITKIVSKTLRCGTTGQWTTINTLVTVPSPAEAQLAKIRAAREAQLDAEAEIEAGAMKRHRQVRPDVQKLGWQR